MVIYIATAIVLLPLDAAFLATIGSKLFKVHVNDMLAEQPRYAPAILFYVLYILGVVTFVNGAAPDDWQRNLLYGALFGLFCYATFELTNMALLKHWEWAVVIPDILWGMFVTAIAAAVGALLADWLMSRI